MAKVRKKKTLQETIEETQKPFSPGISRSMVNPMLGSLSGLNAGMEPEGMKQQMDTMEMRNQGAPSATPAPMPAKKVRKKKSKSDENIGEQQPLSPQTWVNIGNQPSAYNEYLAAWKKKFGKK